MQKKSHQALMSVLNNIGIVGSILFAIADIIFVIIFVVGIKIDIEKKAIVLFAIVNSIVGLAINSLLRYQGQRYAEIENEDLRKLFYDKKAKERKHTLTMNVWQSIEIFKDFIFKGCSTAFSIFGIVYLSIEGSKNPIQILLCITNLILFACFGLISMNNSYNRYYDVQVPYMELKIKEKEK